MHGVITESSVLSSIQCVPLETEGISKLALVNTLRPWEV